MLISVGAEFSSASAAVRLAYAITINKRSRADLYGPSWYLFAENCFGHGQLFTAISRVD